MLKSAHCSVCHGSVSSAPFVFSFPSLAPSPEMGIKGRGKIREDKKY